MSMIPTTENPTSTPPTATILPFKRKRGRPRKNLPARDLGTPELLAKKAQGETAEALDLCLERGIITQRQHWCGMHLRWLYTLRHGITTVRAYLPSLLKHGDVRLEDNTWRAEREQEYRHAINALEAGGYGLILLNLCVMDERPAFLRMEARITAQRAHRIERDLMLIRHGLDVLDRLWRKSKK